jgi:hypothetical protein
MSASNGNDSHTPDKLSQLSFDPSIYSMESFDPSSNNEEFDPSDNENDSTSSRDSCSSRRSERFDVRKRNPALEEQLDRIRSENEKLREERDALRAALAEAKVCSPRSSHRQFLNQLPSHLVSSETNRLTFQPLSGLKLNSGDLIFLQNFQGIAHSLTEDLQSKEQTIKDLLARPHPTKADTVPPADASDLASAEIALSKLLSELQQETDER